MAAESDEQQGSVKTAGPEVTREAERAGSAIVLDAPEVSPPVRRFYANPADV
jgi:hypothetical protein